MDLDIAKEELPHGVLVRVTVRLSGRESSKLFMKGDLLIQLPLEGAQPDSGGAPIPRTSIYLSELAASRDGIVRVFDTGMAADSYASSVRQQLMGAMEAS